ncbi:hypothetical protein [Terrisporobacter hibernicus]|uniref:DUF4375 domain-containing protein n=1 Tax=Terrisporobacter hibernicus TaxID=2813371 RepID=A0AAX2ZCU5_9FIRM|nr:hypothetical protein [Terrisporobacter hibernicus]UEL47183.1 hypothetical protein JW646_16340 [Terrisporobacter hibernicus]
MIKNKKVSLIVFILIICAILSAVFIFRNSDNKSKKLEDLNINQLTEIRDKEIDKNLEQLKKLDFTDEEIKERKESILDPDWDFGLVGFVNGNYKDLTEKEKLIREIELVRYINSNNDVMDASGEYFNVINQNIQLRNYLSQNGRDGEFMSYENMKFVIQNIEDLCKYVDFDSNEIVDSFNPYNSETLSEDQKKSLNEEWEKVYSNKNLDPKLKKEIKRIIRE